MKEGRDYVAKLYGVHPRTVTRICGQYSVFDCSVFERVYNEFNALVRAYGFRRNTPIHYGMYTSFDGVHHVATDGNICWNSKELYDRAKRIAGLNQRPYTGDAYELCSYELGHLMNSPVKDKLSFCGLGRNGTSRMTDGIVEYKVPTRYAMIAKQLGLSLFSIENDPEKIFMIKTHKSMWDFSEGIHACFSIYAA